MCECLIYSHAEALTDCLRHSLTPIVHSQMIIYHVAVSTGNIAIDDDGIYRAACVVQNTLQKLKKKHSVKISTSVSDLRF